MSTHVVVDRKKNVENILTYVNPNFGKNAPILGKKLQYYSK